MTQHDNNNKQPAFIAVSILEARRSVELLWNSARQIRSASASDAQFVPLENLAKDIKALMTSLGGAILGDGAGDIIWASHTAEERHDPKKLVVVIDPQYNDPGHTGQVLEVKIHFGGRVFYAHQEALGTDSAKWITGKNEEPIDGEYPDHRIEYTSFANLLEGVMGDTGSLDSEEDLGETFGDANWRVSANTSRGGQRLTLRLPPHSWFADEVPEDNEWLVYGDGGYVKTVNTMKDAMRAIYKGVKAKKEADGQAEGGE